MIHVVTDPGPLVWIGPAHDGAGGLAVPWCGGSLPVSDLYPDGSPIADVELAALALWLAEEVERRLTCRPGLAYRETVD